MVSHHCRHVEVFYDDLAVTLGQTRTQFVQLIPTNVSDSRMTAGQLFRGSPSIRRAFLLSAVGFRQPA
jgi:recombinational DNA repair ATPase RecF